jgi:hypothetical protein
MPDDPRKKAPSDRTWVNINEPWEFTYWVMELEISEDDLRAAVRTVGTRVKDVRKHLANTR